MWKSKITLGKIVKTVGLKGEVKIYPYGNSDLFTRDMELEVSGEIYTVKTLRFQKGLPIITFDKITDIHQAEKLVHKEVIGDKDSIELDEGSYFVEDLIGFEAWCDGKPVGTLIDIETEMAQDLYVFLVDGKKRYVPGVEEYILNIDTEKRKIDVILIEGI